MKGTVLGGVMLSGCAERNVSFKGEVQPILADKCVECHQPGGRGAARAGLRMDSYAGLMAGSRRGPIVRPGDPASSVLNQVIEALVDGSIGMSQRGSILTVAEKRAVQRWIAQGARNN